MVNETPFSQTWREERANAASHGLGFLLLLGALPVLAQQAPLLRPSAHPLGLAVFVATLVLTYLVSAAYHAMPVGPAKRLLRRCDHAVIFIFIAGSFTPFALSQSQQAGAGNSLLLVWGLALAGAALKLGGRLHRRGPSTALYLLFGWLVALAGLPAIGHLPGPGLQLLVAGGLAYSVGCVFFLLDRRMAYSHLVWHLFVLTGSACHLAAAQLVLA